MMDIGYRTLHSTNGIEFNSHYTSDQKNHHGHLWKLNHFELYYTNIILTIYYCNGMQVMELSHHILMDTLTALAPTTLLSRWST